MHNVKVSIAEVFILAGDAYHYLWVIVNHDYPTVGLDQHRTLRLWSHTGNLSASFDATHTFGCSRCHLTCLQARVKGGLAPSENHSEALVENHFNASVPGPSVDAVVAIDRPRICKANHAHPSGLKSCVVQHVVCNRGRAGRRQIPI